MGPRNCNNFFGLKAAYCHTFLAQPQASCTIEGKSLHVPGSVPGRDGQLYIDLCIKIAL